MSFGQDKDDDTFNIVNSYFIGPKAANLPDFRANINTILDELLETRLNYYPEDNVCSSFPTMSANSTNLDRNGNSLQRKSGDQKSSSRSETILVMWSERFHSFWGSTLFLSGPHGMRATCVQI